MLELFTRDDVPDRDRMPVTAELIDSLRELLAEGVNGGYDIDAVLFQLALSIMQLETKLLDSGSDVINLETRILEAGLRVRPPD